MRRFGFLCLLAAGLLQAQESPERPNLVLLLTDDQSTLTMGCYGAPEARTPQMDRLASEGLVFDRHYVSTAICMASRASIMTGKYEYRTGCNFEHGALLQDHWEESYPVLLRRAGYRTAFAGKFGFEVAPAPRTRGILPEGDFDMWGGGPGQTWYETARNESMKAYAERHPHSTRAYGAFGRDFILESARLKVPFCLSISFKAPHRPVTPDPAFDHVYRGVKFTRPPNYGRRNGLHFSPQSRQGRQYVRFSEWGYDEDYDRVMALYHQQIHAVDAALGMIREALAEAGVADETVIVFTSDNGFLCGAHGYGSKVLPYEEASRVPLVIHDPRRETTPRRSAALTGNVDLAPTLLDLAGLEPPRGMDGRSLLPLLQDPEAAVREYLPLINVWGPAPVHSLAVVSSEWKYIHWFHGADGFVPAEELYHLDADPWELTNLAPEPAHRAALQTLRRAYDRQVADWKARAVPYHDYTRFGVLFDRHIPWSEKVSRP